MFDPEEFGEGIGEGKEPERDEPAKIDAGA
jgi:hypothetical protein